MKSKNTAKTIDIPRLKSLILLSFLIISGTRVSFSMPVVADCYSYADGAISVASSSSHYIHESAAATPVTYKKINSDDQLVIGGKYILVCESEKVALGLIEKGMGTIVPVTISKGVAEITSENSKDNPYEITLCGTPGAYVLQTEQGTLGWQINNEFSIDGTDNLWNITFNEKGDAVFSDNVHRYGILYNNVIDKFLTYAQSNTKYLKCQLYKKEAHNVETGTITIKAAKHTTFYSEQAFVMPVGIAGGIVTSANKETGRLTTDYRYTEGKTVPAKTPLLIKGEAGTYTFYYDYTCMEEPVAGNMLHATVDASGYTYVEGNGVKYYMLSYDKTGKNLGFYWGEENGAPFKNNPPHAYLAVEGAIKASSAFMFDSGDNTTGIGIIEPMPQARNLVYSVTGVCLGTDSTNLPKGIYVKNGKKIIKR